MELIIKPTERCNFACTFCSSTKLTDTKSQILDLDQVFLFLKRFPNTNTIIVNGGDPLIMSPDYYWKIIQFLDQHEMETTLSFTTNLWNFYIRPSRWIELFRDPRVGVTTSFHYGESRLISKDRIFKEDDFWKISDLFLEKVGYRPDFISVIDEDNEDLALKNVELAKKMGVECKLNYAMASGEQSKPYVLSRAYQLYVEVYKHGLTEWEYNTKQMAKRLSTGATTCPQNRDCDDSIRCLQPDGDYYSCGAFGDDKLFQIDFEKEMNSHKVQRPLKYTPDVSFMKDECLSCPMFQICNGCKKTIFDLKNHSLVDEHCARMKGLAPTIMEINSQNEYQPLY